QSFLGLERLYRVKVVTHDPRQTHVRTHRYQIGKPKHRLPVALETPALHRSIVTGDRFHPQTGHNFVSGVFSFELARLDQRPPVLGEITRTITLTRMLSVVQLGAGNEVTGIRKRWRRLSVIIQTRIAAGVIEMQMRIDDDRYFVSRDTSPYL